MNRILMAACVFVSAASLGGCSDTSPAPTATEEHLVPTPRGFMISNSLKATDSTAAVLGAPPQLEAADRVVYISAIPGTFPSPAHGQVRNQTIGGTPSGIVITDGGIDPVAVAASAGDDLRLTISLPDGPITFVVRVPPRMAPEVVRTEPAQGRINISRDASVNVVFSEPIDGATVTPSSVTLYEDDDLDDGAVSALVEISSDGLTAILSPVDLLKPNTSYTLGLTGAVKDRDGDGLLASAALKFVTRGP